MYFLAQVIPALTLFLQVYAELQPTYGSKFSNGDHNGGELSAMQILDKGIAALGGRSKLQALKGISTHAS